LTRRRQQSQPGAIAKPTQAAESIDGEIFKPRIAVRRDSGACRSAIIRTNARRDQALARS